MKVLPVILLLSALAALAFAQEFTCPSGYREDIQCAASCCEMSGGSYSYSDVTCTTETRSQLEAAFRCEADEGCCVPTGPPDGGFQPSTGCCGAFILLALGAIPLLAVRNSSR